MPSSSSIAMEQVCVFSPQNKIDALVLTRAHQSNAELALLSQSLAKSKRVSERLILSTSNFENRLARLEKSLVPIHKQTGRLTRVSKSTLSKSELRRADIHRPKLS